MDVDASTYDSEDTDADAPGRPPFDTDSLDAGGGADGAPTDPVPATCAETGTTCTDALTDGWRAVALPKTPGAACPTDYATVDLTTATAGEDACSCTPGPSAEDPPSCERDPEYKATFGELLCTIDHAPYDVTPGACITMNLQPLAAKKGRFKTIRHDGQCALACTADPAKLAPTPIRICEPSSTCAETACVGTKDGAPPSDAVTYCLEHEGDVPCPDPSAAGDASAPDGAADDDAAGFERTVVGTDAALACTGGSCTSKVTCDGAKVQTFTSNDCSGNPAAAVTPDGDCRGLGDGAKTFRYVPGVTNISYEVAPPVPTVTFEATRTICCRR